MISLQHFRPFRQLPVTCSRLLTARTISLSCVTRSEASTAFQSLPYLHVHPVNDSKNAPHPSLKYALTYLEQKDIPSNKSLFEHPQLIIGWMPDKSNLSPKTFTENQQFISFMTKVLNENIHKINDPVLKGLAEWQKEGWLNIGDERNPPPWGRIPFPEDIIGMVLLKDGKIQPHTYQNMPAHRMVTNNGIFQLTEPLTRCIIEAAKKAVGK